jgi:hypothetical protein
MVRKTKKYYLCSIVAALFILVSIFGLVCTICTHNQNRYFSIEFIEKNLLLCYIVFSSMLIVGRVIDKKINN